VESRVSESVVGNRLVGPSRGAVRSVGLVSGALMAGGGLLALLASGAGAVGQIITVDTLDEDTGSAADCLPSAGSCSLRDALLAAGDDDVIVFDEGLTGTIALSTELSWSKGSLSIVGPGSSALTIDAEAEGRVFYLYGPGPSSNVSISGLTITGGDAGGKGQGGGIYAMGIDDLTLTDVVITGNSAGSGGGGLFIDGNDSLRIEDSTFSNNYSSDYGGALYTDGSDSVEIVNSTFVNNTALKGGAVVSFSDTGTLYIAHSVFDSNSATSDRGGALYLYNSGDTTITNTTFSKNHASSPGGAINFDHDNAVTATITGCTFDGNSSDSRGGAISASTTRDLTLNVSNSTFNGNSATAGSAIVIDNDTTLYVNLSTIVGNSSNGISRDGGAIYQDGSGGVFDGTVTLSGTIVSGNIAPAGLPADLALDELYSNTWNVDNSLIGDVDPNLTLNGSGIIISVDAGVGLLAENGGPTMTMALLEGAAAIDAGPDPVATFVGNGFDQRGTPFVRVYNGRVDIGAFEAQPDPTPTTTTTTEPTTTSTASDGEVVPVFTG
jgi:predicted outer membrane repeat protein/parallel beta-helix repeat protein